MLSVNNAISNAAIDSRRGLMGMIEAGVQNVKTWLVANIPHEPDLFDFVVDTFGSVHSRSSHRLVDSLRALHTWKIQGSGIQKELSLKCNLLQQDLPSDWAGLFHVDSTPDSYLSFAFHEKTPMVGILTTHLVDVMGCGKRGTMEQQCYLLLSLVDVKPRTGELGVVCRLAMVLRPDIGARLTRTVSWQQSTQLNAASFLVWDDAQYRLSLDDVFKGKCMRLEEHAWNTPPDVGLLNMHSEIMLLLRLLDLNSYNPSMMRLQKKNESPGRRTNSFFPCMFFIFFYVFHSHGEHLHSSSSLCIWVGSGKRKKHNGFEGREGTDFGPIKEIGRRD